MYGNCTPVHTMYMYTYIHVHVYTVYVDGCGYCTLLFVRTPYSIYICIVIVTYMYMKIHVPSMLAIGIDKHTQRTYKQPQWLH